LEQDSNDIKDLSVRVFKTSLALDGKTWLFDVRKHHSADPRFEGTVINDAEQPVEFVMVRTSIGKWSITGDRLPSQMEEYVQKIGDAFEKKSSRLKNYQKTL
jgi:hypothetical protein